jgi:hypothetical protein
MAKNKTTQNEINVTDFIKEVPDENKRNDSLKLVEIMKKQTGFEPKMWGAAIIGFGSYHYKYESGHEGDAPLVGFSPRKNAIAVYLMLGNDRNIKLVEKLGKYKKGGGCLYINKLGDVNIEILRELIVDTVKYLKTKYPAN